MVTYSGMTKQKKETIEGLLDKVREYAPQTDLDMIKLAYEFARDAHEGQFRKSGEPYIILPLGAAHIVADMKIDPVIIVATLLHDVPEDTEVTLDELEKNFGEEIRKLVEGITKLGKLKYRGVERYIENLRKMFVAMAEDVRVMIIKFADRIHNLTTLKALPTQKQYRIALESLEIYAPIANRLGMGEIKGQLEDLAFKYLYPKDYEELKTDVSKKYKLKGECLKKIRLKLLKAVAGFSVEQNNASESKTKNAERIKIYSIHGRTKRLWSIFNKLKTKNAEDLSRIYDLVALRVIVNTVAECYTVLGIIHQIWKPLKGRIKDYIAQPKPNGYQSLHTTVFCDDGEIVEFQIRTKKMHDEAEYGVAAHWYYDEKGSVAPANNELKWVKELTKWKKEFEENQKFLETLKIDVFQNRIFIFTPKGDVIDLPENSTPIDFAYTLHTDLGDKCTGAKVNDKTARLDTRLQNGDVVEIITDRNKKNPSPDWLGFVKKRTAKNKIKSRLQKAKIEDEGYKIICTRCKEIIKHVSKKPDPNEPVYCKKCKERMRKEKNSLIKN